MSSSLIDIFHDYGEYVYTWISDTSNTRLVCTACTAFLTSYYLIHRLQLKQPPGPWYLPVLGNFRTFTNNRYIYRSFEQLYKTYGELCYVRVGPFPCIVVSGQAMIRRIFVDNKDVFSDRVTQSPFFRFAGGGKGIIKSNYQVNKMSRKFTMTTLRNFGLGKANFEEKIQNEADILVNEMLTYGDESFDPGSVLTKAVANIIFMLVVNKRHEYDDEGFIALLRNIHTVVDKFGMGYRSLSFLPVKLVIALSENIRTLLKATTEVKKYIKLKIDENKDTYDEEHINSFVDVYLKLSHESQDSTLFDNVPEIINDLLIAGVETTNTTLRFFVFYMCKYPDIQKKCREEILEAIGGTTRPCLADRSKLLYNNATQLELLRLASTVPYAIPHTCMQPVTLDGYHYEPHTIFLPNIYCCHMNEETFPQPHEFKPERWIGDDGKLITPPLDYMPFGVGPRSCIGDTLAKNELFLFSVTMIQRLTLSYDGDIPEPDIEMGVSRRIAQPLRVLATSNST